MNDSFEKMVNDVIADVFTETNVVNLEFAKIAAWKGMMKGIDLVMECESFKDFEKKFFDKMKEENYEIK